MTPLRHNDWLQLQEAILELQEASTLAEMPATVLRSLRHVLQFDSASVQDDRGGLRCVPWLFEDQKWHPGTVGVRMMTEWNPKFTLLREAFFAASGEHHPHTVFFRRTQEGAARRLSDLMSARVLRRTALYNEICRKNGLRWQLTIYVSMPEASTLTVAACRTDGDFSERDKAALDLLRPHVARAWRRTQITSRSHANVAELGSPEALAALRALGLSPREAEVLRWVTAGKTNSEIALILGLTPGTVKFYVERILRQLGCETRTAAALIAVEALQPNPKSPA